MSNTSYNELKANSLKRSAWLWPLLILLPLNIWLGIGGYAVLLSTLLLSILLWGIWFNFRSLYPKGWGQPYLYLSFLPNLYLFLATAFLANWLAITLQIICSAFLAGLMFIHGKMLERRKLESLEKKQSQPEAAHRPYHSEQGEHRRNETS